MPEFYSACIICAKARSIGAGPPAHGLLRCAPPYDKLWPFGSLPGFVTSLGVVAVPEDPIGGYVYAGGAGDKTVWQLHADAVYL